MHGIASTLTLTSFGAHLFSSRVLTQVLFGSCSTYYQSYNILLSSIYIDLASVYYTFFMISSHESNCVLFYTHHLSAMSCYLPTSGY